MVFGFHTNMLSIWGWASQFSSLLAGPLRLPCSGAGGGRPIQVHALHWGCWLYRWISEIHGKSWTYHSLYIISWKHSHPYSLYMTLNQVFLPSCPFTIKSLRDVLKKKMPQKKSQALLGHLAWFPKRSPLRRAHYWMEWGIWGLPGTQLKNLDLSNALLPMFFFCKYHKHP